MIEAPAASKTATPFAWGERTYVMAIVNATPDSFSGDGVDDDLSAAVQLAVAAEAGGADLIDIGAESTRPGHIPVAAAQELARLLPIMQSIKARTSLPISIDTSKAAVADAALQAGAAMINDVRGFIVDPELAAVVAAWDVPAIVMHDVEPDPHDDLMHSVIKELDRRVDRAVQAGVKVERIIIDPGFGFGKDWRQNLEMLKRLAEFRVLDRPILVGLSRKSTIGRVLGLPESDRVEGTVATTCLAIANGADIVRVHDVLPNVRAARMTDAVVRRPPTEAKTWSSR